MDVEKIDMFIMLNKKFFKRDHIDLIRDRLISVDNSKWETLLKAEFNDPTTVLIVSIFAGSLGIDRFMIGDIEFGVFKLLTCGGFGIWAILDWISIQEKTRKSNIQKFNQLLY